MTNSSEHNDINDPIVQDVLNEFRDEILISKNNKEMNEAFGKETIISYIKLRSLEIKEFQSKESFDKTKPISKWEKDNTLDC